MNSVSFIIPALNASETLADTLKSIRNQKTEYPVQEIIVVDNGSTDPTVELAEQSGAVVYADPEASIAKLRNLGSEKAIGDILIFADADCILPISWVQIAGDFLCESTIAMVGSRVLTLRDKATWIEQMWNIHLRRHKGQKQVQWLPSVCFAVKKSIFEEAGGFNEELQTCEDVDLGYRIGQNHEILSDENLSVVHLGEPKTLSQLFYKEMWRGKDNFQVGKKKAFSAKEVIGMLLPVWHILGFLGLIGSLVCQYWCISCIFLLALLVPVFLLSIDTAIRAKSFLSIFPLCLVYFAYIAGRSLAFLRNLC